MPPPHDFTGREFERGTVIGYAGVRKTPSGRSLHQWTIRCRCGRIHDVDTERLTRNKNCQQCSNKLQRYRHGATANRKVTKEYWTWNHLRKRHPPEEFDPRWRDALSFLNFLADMGPKPSKYHWLKRIDKSKPYGPGNCVWEKRGGPQKRYEFEGQMYTIGELAFVTGIHRDTLRRRLKTCTVEVAVSAPIGYNSHARPGTSHRPQQSLGQGQDTNPPCPSTDRSE